MDQFLQKHRTNDPTKATHLSLVGGKYSIRSPQDVSLFRNLYVREPNRHFLVERACYPSIFFVDLDKCSMNVDDVQRIFTQEHVYVYSNFQNGFHILFRNVVVKTPSEAKTRCEQFCDQYPCFREFVDLSVYTSGLRMIGSKKSLHVARVYYPIRSSRTITVRDLEQSSIHHQIEFSKPWVRENNLHHTSKTTCFLNLGDLYPSVGIKSIQLNHPFVTIISNSTYCANLQRNHKSKNAYFVLNLETKRLVQKCLCRCTNTGCGEYRSKPTTIAPRSYSIICSQLL